MRFPKECYQVYESIDQYFPHLRSSQKRGLALWVVGTVLAKSGCQSAVISVLP